MTSKHPPSWRLWHPNQGVVFQQPLYPVLDMARSFSEAPAAKTMGADDFVADRRRDETIQGQEPTTGSSDKEPAGSEQTVPANNAPYTPLDWKIPEEIFQAAKAAPEGSAASFWSYTLYRGPNDEDDGNSTRQVKVHYCRSAQTAEKILQMFVEEKVLGLDLEWVAEATRFSGPRRNVSLVQLANKSRVVLLHLALYPARDELVTPTLRRILESPEITKVGVWIKGDCSRLQKHLGITTRSIFELSHLFNQVKHSASGTPHLINKKLVSLATQVQDTMGLPLLKEQGVRSSDWSRPLTMSQIGYSASDAYAAVHLFAMLNHKRENLDPAPDIPFHAELDRPIPRPPGIESSSSDSEAEVDEEPADEAKVEAESSETKKITRLVSECLGIIDGSIEMEDGDGDVAASKLSKPRRTAAKPAKPPPPPKDPRILAAETWLEEYKSTRPEHKPKSSSAKLRAYFLWHDNEDLVPASIARLLRDPPLQTDTVVTYILDVVTAERLPYNKTRMQMELLSAMPAFKAERMYSRLYREAMQDYLVPRKYYN